MEAFHAGLREVAASTGEVPDRAGELAPVVEASHDLPYIARLVTGRHWRSFSEEQQASFVTTFSELSVATYARRAPVWEGERLTITDVLPQPRGRWLVQAQFRRDEADPMVFEYVLHEADSGWRIVNILVDGVSDLALKRAEYSALLDDGGYEALIAELQQQIAALMDNS